MIFVDTGAWFARLVTSDDDHTAAAAWLQQNTQPLVTTDYVIDETLTLLKRRGHPNRAFEIGEAFFSGELATIVYLTQQDILESWQVFRRYRDKGWSFTDCSSKVVMERLQLTHAFAFDDHFHQFGTITVVPS